MYYTNVTVSRVGYFVGGFVGINYGKIDTSFVTDTTITGQDDTGGFVGSSWNGTIKKCYVDRLTVNGNRFVGGFCGLHGIANDTNLTTTYTVECSVKNTVVRAGNSIAGGFTGGNQAGSKIYNSFVQTTTITGQNNRIGGFVGENRATATVEKCSVINCEVVHKMYIY